MTIKKNFPDTSEEQWSFIKDYIWFNRETKKYHFEDETQNFSHIGYDSIAEARKALSEYADSL